MSEKIKTQCLEYEIDEKSREVCWLGMIIVRKDGKPNHKHVLVVPRECAWDITEEERKKAERFIEAFKVFVNQFEAVEKIAYGRGEI